MTCKKFLLEFGSLELWRTLRVRPQQEVAAARDREAARRESHTWRGREKMGMILLNRTMTPARRRIRINQRKERRQEDSREIGTIHQVCARSMTTFSATYSIIRMMITVSSST